jgi:hypothetical protein
MLRILMNTFHGTITLVAAGQERLRPPAEA